MVLDECDELLTIPSMRPAVTRILGLAHASTQFILTSATVPQAVRRQLIEIIPDCLETILPPNPARIRQFRLDCTEDNKLESLTRVLDGRPYEQGIIFVNRRERAQRLTEHLRSKLFNPLSIHSWLDQHTRLLNYERFKRGTHRLIVATDVMSRGIDIGGVDLVINYGSLVLI